MEARSKQLCLIEMYRLINFQTKIESRITMTVTAVSWQFCKGVWSPHDYPCVTRMKPLQQRQQAGQAQYWKTEK